MRLAAMERLMLDVIFVVSGILFFAAAAWYSAACEKL
jgi:hypothetical protein